jgi:LysM repeat protein
MNLVTPCTDQPNCYLYTVRSGAQNGSGVNDNVDGIARFFGVKASSILELNPTAAQGITPGQQLKIPPPTR